MDQGSDKALSDEVKAERKRASERRLMALGGSDPDVCAAPKAAFAREAVRMLGV